MYKKMGEKKAYKAKKDNKLAVFELGNNFIHETTAYRKHIFEET